MKKILLFFLIIIFMGCEELVDGVDKNPNSLTADQIVPSSVLPGAQVANVLVQAGHLMRISGLYSGQFIAYQSLYLNIYSYNLTAEESISTWERAYVNCLPQLRFIQEQSAGDGLLTGIAKVLEANLMGTVASYHGNVPYSQAVNSDFPDPVFDSQVSVFNSLIQLLDSGISDLNSGSSRSLSEDIYFGGDAEKWIAAANTLKARFYMYLREYGNAYAAAQNGISDPADDLLYVPTGEDGVAGTKNTFWEIINGSRAGDMGHSGSFMESLLDPENPDSRNHAKTDETARANYYAIDETSAAGNLGAINENEPMPLITFRENHMILAEAGFRSQGASVGLQRLNEFRAYLRNGAWINSNFAGDPATYDDFVLEDFAPGGIENPDNIDQERALLREIMEEKYVSGYMSFLPFDDIRRWRKNDNDIAPDVPRNTPGASAHPERLPYSSNELTSNDNAPNPEPGIFAKTEVNQ
jgi:hypothetical protein